MMSDLTKQMQHQLEEQKEKDKELRAKEHKLLEEHKKKVLYFRLRMISHVNFFYYFTGNSKLQAHCWIRNLTLTF